ncbi:hypothetical protein AAMO2058_001329600 [Amorphochlora amoebiformis]
MDCVPNPISIQDIKNGLRGDKYTSFDQVIQDVRQIFENASSCHLPGSVGYQDAYACLEALESSLLHIPYKIRPPLHPLPVSIVRRTHLYVSQRAMMGKRPLKCEGEGLDSLVETFGDQNSSQIYNVRSDEKESKSDEKESKVLTRKRRKKGPSIGQRKKRYKHQGKNADSTSFLGSSNGRKRPKAVGEYDWKRLRNSRWLARNPIKMSKLSRHQPSRGELYLKAKGPEEHAGNTEHKIVSAANGWVCGMCERTNRSGLYVCRHCWHNRYTKQSQSAHFVTTNAARVRTTRTTAERPRLILTRT